MSLPDRHIARRRRLAAVTVLLAALSAGAGCTVRPLYSDVSETSGIAPVNPEALGVIAIAPVNTRYGQEVRNHLIFLLNGGAGQPAAAAYTMNLQVASIFQSSASVQIDNEDRPTAGTLKMIGTYQLTDVKTGKVILSSQRDISSSFDQPSQQFAALRARRDAENRAARELAYLLRLDIGQRMATRTE